MAIANSPIQAQVPGVLVGVSATTAKLLAAASEVVGGDDALAECLGVSYARMCGFLADRIALPDELLLKAVDIILEDRLARGIVPGPKIYERPGRV